jgi:predicted TIM-barrel fold metal-dependent hydrolase
MFGSDYPFRPATEAAQGLGSYSFSNAERSMISRQTALRLLPGLAT